MGTHCIGEGDGYDYDDDNVSTAFVVKLVERSDPTNDRKLSKIVHQNDKYSTIEFSFWNWTTRHNHNGFRTFFLFCAIFFPFRFWLAILHGVVCLIGPSRLCMHSYDRVKLQLNHVGELFYFSLLRKFIENELCLCSDAYGQTHERRTLCVIAAGNMHFAFDTHKYGRTYFRMHFLKKPVVDSNQWCLHSATKMYFFVDNRKTYFLLAECVLTTPPQNKNAYASNIEHTEWD